jgi:hypothetical protein
MRTNHSDSSLSSDSDIPSPADCVRRVRTRPGVAVGAVFGVIVALVIVWLVAFGVASAYRCNIERHIDHRRVQSCANQSGVLCSSHGECVIDDDGLAYCHCDSGFTAPYGVGTYPDTHDIVCSYEQKKQIVAFNLAFFFGYIPFAPSALYAETYTTVYISMGIFVGVSLLVIILARCKAICAPSLIMVWCVFGLLSWIAHIFITTGCPVDGNFVLMYRMKDTF